MSLLHGVALAIAIALFIYLLVALFQPERF
jgi:K+-transporting ATPase KdpF subunit